MTYLGFTCLDNVWGFSPKHLQRFFSYIITTMPAGSTEHVFLENWHTCAHQGCQYQYRAIFSPEIYSTLKIMHWNVFSASNIHSPRKIFHCWTVAEQVKAAVSCNPSYTVNNILRLQKTEAQHMTDSLGLPTYYIRLFLTVTTLIILI